MIDKPLVLGDVPSIRHFKARLIARGVLKTKGINFDETYASVIRFQSLRIILHLASLNDWQIDQGDFVSAFLNSILHDYMIYMVQPEGYVQDPSLVCLMLKSIYGLRQFARAWWEALNETLECANPLLTMYFGSVVSFSSSVMLTIFSLWGLAQMSIRRKFILRQHTTSKISVQSVLTDILVW